MSQYLCIGTPLIFPFLWVIWTFSFCYMVLFPGLCNDKWWMPSYAYIHSALLKRPFEKKLINNKMSPISAKLVIGFWWSSTVMGGNLWSNQVSVWWERKESAEWIENTYSLSHSLSFNWVHTYTIADFNICRLPNSIPTENMSATSSRRQRHYPNRWWRVWNRFVLFSFTCLRTRHNV